MILGVDKRSSKKSPSKRHRLTLLQSNGNSLSLNVLLRGVHG